MYVRPRTSFSRRQLPALSGNPPRSPPLCSCPAACCLRLLQALDVMQVAAVGQGGQAAPQVDLVISADTVRRPGLPSRTWRQGSTHPSSHRMEALLVRLRRRHSVTNGRSS